MKRGQVVAAALTGVTVGACGGVLAGLLVTHSTVPVNGRGLVAFDGSSAPTVGQTVAVVPGLVSAGLLERARWLVDQGSVGAYVVRVTGSTSTGFGDVLVGECVVGACPSTDPVALSGVTILGVTQEGP